MVKKRSFAHAPSRRISLVRCFATNLVPPNRPLSWSLANPRCWAPPPRLSRHCKCWTARHFLSQNNCSFLLGFPMTFSGCSYSSISDANLRTSCRFGCRSDLWRIAFVIAYVIRVEKYQPVSTASIFFSSRLGYGFSRLRTNQSFSSFFISGVNSLLTPLSPFCDHDFLKNSKWKHCTYMMTQKPWLSFFVSGNWTRKLQTIVSLRDTNSEHLRFTHLEFFLLRMGLSWRMDVISTKFVLIS